METRRFEQFRSRAPSRKLQEQVGPACARPKYLPTSICSRRDSMIPNADASRSTDEGLKRHVGPSCRVLEQARKAEVVTAPAVAAVSRSMWRLQRLHALCANAFLTRAISRTSPTRRFPEEVPA